MVIVTRRQSFEKTMNNIMTTNMTRTSGRTAHLLLQRMTVPGTIERMTGIELGLINLQVWRMKRRCRIVKERGQEMEILLLSW